MDEVDGGDGRGRRAAGGSEGGASLDEIAAELGCSRQRAQFILGRALAKARVVLERRGVTTSDDLIGTMLLRD